MTVIIIVKLTLPRINWDGRDRLVPVGLWACLQEIILITLRWEECHCGWHHSLEMVCEPCKGRDRNRASACVHWSIALYSG